MPTILPSMTNDEIIEVTKIYSVAGLLRSDEPLIRHRPFGPPKEKLGALMADPKSLADLLRRHIVEGYYPPNTLITGQPTGGFDRTLANMLGEKLDLTGFDPFSVNGEDVGTAESVMVANGSRVFYLINKVFSSAVK